MLEQLLGVQTGLIAGFAKLREEGRIDFGVTAGNIRKLAEEGVLTADLVTEALLAAGELADTNFGKLVARVSDSMAVLGNAAGDLAGRLDASAGASKAFAGEITDVAAALDSRSWARVADELGALDNTVATVAAALRADVRGGEAVGGARTGGVAGDAAEVDVGGGAVAAEGAPEGARPPEPSAPAAGRRAGAGGRFAARLVRGARAALHLCVTAPPRSLRFSR